MCSYPCVACGRKHTPIDLLVDDEMVVRCRKTRAAVWDLEEARRLVRDEPGVHLKLEALLA